MYTILYIKRYNFKFMDLGLPATAAWRRQQTAVQRARCTPKVPILAAEPNDVVDNIRANTTRALGFGFQTHSGTDVTRNIHTHTGWRKNLELLRNTSGSNEIVYTYSPLILLLAAQHVRQVVFTHRLGQRQASVLAARESIDIPTCKTPAQFIMIPLPRARAAYLDYNKLFH
jgi:hypothetical protein